eukprot:jgi/Ulvmu1/4124/UM019_0103.1
MTEWLPSVTWDTAAYTEDESKANPVQKVGKTVAKKRASKARTIEKLAEDVILFKTSVAREDYKANEGEVARQKDACQPGPAQTDVAVQGDLPSSKVQLKRNVSSADAAPQLGAEGIDSTASKKQKKSSHAKHVAAQIDVVPRSGQQDSTLIKMRNQLQGGRFRMLNEQLYTTQGQEAYSLMQESPELFRAYHEGFRVQSQTWKVNPVDVAIRWLQKHPKIRTVADFGCGDAKIAQTLCKTHNVHSFDLFAHNEWVTACNMAHVPCGAGTCDAAVFSLALMGTDYSKFLEEAQRVLKMRGWLWIAEVRSRFVTPTAKDEDFDPFLQCIQSLGFEMIKHDSKNQMFVVWTFQKLRVGMQPQAIQWPELKPCIYKRR